MTMYPAARRALLTNGSGSVAVKLAEAAATYTPNEG
jgi:hypothetical protein